MAEYESIQDAVERHQLYPDLKADLAAHAFQRRRVASSVAFIQKGDIVLDVACNSGYFKSYCPQAAEVHGVDCSVTLVAEAEKRLDSARVARAEMLPFPSKHFDVVNVSGLLEQVFDPESVMREAARVCRRSLVGNTVHEKGTWGKQRTERHQWQSYSWSEKEIRDLLSKFGRIDTLGTIDVNTPPEPQCWFWHVLVGEK